MLGPLLGAAAVPQREPPLGCAWCETGRHSLVGRGDRAHASHPALWEVPGSKPGGLLYGSRNFCPALGLHVSGPIYDEN